MLHFRVIVLLAALPLLAACASDEQTPGRRRQTYGPGNTLPARSATGDIGTFQGAAGWRASGAESFHPQSLPPGFKAN
jgi:hypothetical protein